MGLSTAVVISTYNGQQYIEEQLDSIRRQSQTPDEVIIVDDCSTDKTVSLIENYIKDFKLHNWHLTINESNKGWEKNFMDGMSLAKSDLIFPCDQDDYWYPDKIKVMAKLMTDNQEIDVLTSDYHKNYASQGHPEIKNRFDNHVHKIPVQSSFMRVDYPGCAYCVRASFFRRIQELWFARCPHDALLWRTAMFHDGLYKVSMNLIEWRQHSDSAFKKQNKNKSYQYQLDYLEYNEKVLNQLKRWIKITGFKKYSHYLDEQYSLLQFRKRFYRTKNPLIILSLLKRLSYYPKKKTILRDIYTVYLLK